MSFGIAVVILGSIVAVRSQSTPSQPSVNQQLVGRWEKPLTDTPTPAPSGFRFFSDGKVIFSLPYGYDLTTRTALVGTYAIDPKPKPMQIALQFGDQPAKPNPSTPPTVFELKNDRTLLLQQSKSWNPGQFEQPPEFTKVSDSTVSTPEASQLSQAQQSKTGEGGLMMRHLALSALYYSVEMKRFPKTLTELGISDTTQNYRYQLQANSKQLTLVARSTKDNLKSYSAIVAQVTNPGTKDLRFHVTRVCESVRPSRIAPSTPRLLDPNRTPLGTSLIQCGSGSAAIDL
ncbi:hypothetical protein IQ250_19065 [Pseudanabaenaceae cyanobacterium LEGE 13415]|nr:hypothetical protein [Pseudanabaenaceae cyanobacterium LEGE 13415]